ncbi:Eaa1 [Klebsiella pneumoniae]|nr:Eaa1 [Klebsiella pneumoniae]SBX47614.1 Eaa1 [Klebsiella pneumoniae]SBX89295.1 Eaa1 [Klebsiella pneumoniae]SBX95043.1 Eaa1 [Klebsiella pneumoniae]SSK06581.1 Eaa1 [Klebsiella pneumoniae]
MTNNQLAENSVIQLLNSVKLARDNAERADNRVDHSFYYALTIALEELQERRKAAMDSEPVEMPLDYLQGHKDGLEWAAQLAEANHPETGDWLYDDPIELAKAIRKGPDMPPAQPAADSEPVAIIDQANLDYLRSGADADVWPPEREEMGDVLLYRHAQPAPVAPEEMTPQQASRSYGGEVRGYRAGWNACRAAMLQELKKSAGTEAICRSDENVQVLHTKSPAQSDCCPAQNDVAPAQSPIDHGYLPECECSGCKATARICAELAGNSQVIPDGYVMVPDDLKEAAADLLATLDDYQEQLVPINRDSSVVRALRAAMLAAAQQEVKGE